MSWIETSTGRHLSPLSPNPGDVSIYDIAHALSQICRFNGHTRFFYSIAQHCLNVSSLLAQLGYDEEMQLHGLLHDASEAYICDMPKPIKSLIPTYKKIEYTLEQAIYVGLGLSFPPAEVHSIVKKADNISLYQEAYIMLPSPWTWDWSFMSSIDCVLAGNTESNIYNQSMVEVKNAFIQRYEYLRAMTKK